MAHLEFTDNAKRDLFNIIEYTKTNWGAKQANEYIDSIEQACQLLADNPHIGLRWEETAPNLMSYPIESHMLYFQYQNNILSVIRVLHKSMLPENHLT